MNWSFSCKGIFSYQSLLTELNVPCHFSILKDEITNVIHRQEDTLTIGPFYDPRVSILVKENNPVSNDEMSPIDNCPNDLQVFDVLRVSEDYESFESEPTSREVSLHVTYSLQEEPMGVMVHSAIDSACQEHQMKFIS